MRKSFARPDGSDLRCWWRDLALSEVRSSDTGLPLRQVHAPESSPGPARYGGERTTWRLHRGPPPDRDVFQSFGLFPWLSVSRTYSLGSRPGIPAQSSANGRLRR